MDYVVIELESLSDLEKRDNQYTAIGWKPSGGITAVRQRISGPIIYLQAVYKENSAPAEAAAGLFPSKSKSSQGRPKKDDSGDLTPRQG